MGQESDTSSRYNVPRLLAFYQDLWDDDGTPVGWKPIAWGLRFADGSAVSVNIEGKPAVSLWHSVADALAALDAFVDTPEPRATLDERLAVPPPKPSAPAGPRASPPEPRAKTKP
ncbi:MAG: hypothetical protein ACRD2C_02975 [Acidimicrobiales bacterium]